jgi:hypothetical protein
MSPVVCCAALTHGNVRKNNPAIIRQTTLFRKVITIPSDSGNTADSARFENVRGIIGNFAGRFNYAKALLGQTAGE